MKYFIFITLLGLAACHKPDLEVECLPVKCRSITYGISVCPPNQTIIVHPDTSYFEATTCTMSAFISGLTVKYDQRGPRPECECEEL